MAHDLLLGKTRRNWARGSCTPATTDEVDLRLTEAEMKYLTDLTTTKALADSGDPRARRKMSVVSRNIAKMRARAARGDAQARRSLLVLQESGVFRGVQSFSLGDDDDARQIPNLRYRSAIFKRAMRTGGRSPTTRDFFLAKKNVDRVMEASGLRLYLPGSRPGRTTY